MCKSILFQDNDNVIKFINLDGGNFEVYVSSKKFTGVYEFCIESEQLFREIDNLSALYSSLSGNYTIFDMDSDAYIEIRMKRFGKMEISGRLGGTYQSYYMMFVLDSDQTFLKDIIDFFKKLLVIRGDA